MRLLAAVTIVGATASTFWSPPLLLVWNPTASMPMGLYMVAQGAIRRDDLLVTSLPREMEVLAASHAILAPGAPVLKPIAALAGDRVCRVGSVVSINRRFAAIARTLDAHGRHLPSWRGCRLLSRSQVFLLASHPNSFDSRYWGPVDARLARGIARPLLTFVK